MELRVAVVQSPDGRPVRDPCSPGVAEPAERFACARDAKIVDSGHVRSEKEEKEEGRDYMLMHVARGDSSPIVLLPLPVHGRATCKLRVVWTAVTCRGVVVGDCGGAGTLRRPSW